MDFLSKIVSAISDALRDGEKLPGALMLCGVLKTAAALYLIFFRVPGGVFLHHHDKALICLYCGILIAVVIFGLVESSAGFWVSGDLVGWRAIGKTILWVSILPLIIVAGLGGFEFANPK